MHHDAGVHGGEIEFSHVFVKSGDGGVDQAALVGHQQVDAALERLRLALLPGNEDPAAQRGAHLHGADARARGDARRGLYRQPGDAGDLEIAVHAVILGQEGILAVDVPAAEERVLRVAEHHAPVGDVGMGLLVCHRLL